MHPNFKPTVTKAIEKIEEHFLKGNGFDQIDSKLSFVDGDFESYECKITKFGSTLSRTIRLEFLKAVESVVEAELVMTYSDDGLNFTITKI